MQGKLMKLNRFGRAALATGMSLAVGLGATSCSRDYTVAYVYAVSATNATVSAFGVDYQSGALTQLTGSPFSGTGRNPVAVVATPSGKFLYVINHDDSSVTTFAVGTDGKLYGQQTLSIVTSSPTDPIGGGASFPTSAAIDSAGKFLYVTFTFQTGGTLALPNKGGVAIFPISQTTNMLSTPTAVGVGMYPVSIAVTNPSTGAAAGNTYVYVLDDEAAPSAAPSTNANIIGFQQNPSTGALALLSGSSCTTSVSVPCTGYHAGVSPSGIVVEPTTHYVYVSDKTSNQILGYGISNSAVTPTNNGNLTPLVSSPYITGAYPVSLTIDPRGKYILSANYNANTIGTYTINQADGSLGGVAASGSAGVATGPTCVTVDPALGIYVYTSNQLDGSLSGEKLDANTGQLSALANTPYTAAPLLSCVTSVANGSHAQSIVNP
jgi:6-phosphogluconolactonase